MPQRLVSKSEQQRMLDDRERVRKGRETFLKALTGKNPLPSEFPKWEPEFKCSACRDTAFVLAERFDGTFSSRRCLECKPRVDAETRKNAKRYVPGSEDIPDDAPPTRTRDYKQAAGLDSED